MLLKAPEICKSNSRKLSFWEALFAEMHEKLDGHNTIVGYVSFELKSDKELEDVEFKNVIEKLYQRHPILRATIMGAQEDYLVSLNGDFKKIPITVVKEPEKNWQNYFDRELNTPLNLVEYLWRVVLFKSQNSKRYYIFFTCCHAVVDGGSVMVMLKDTMHGICESLGTLPIKSDSLPFYEAIDVIPSGAKLTCRDKWPFINIANQKLYRTGALIKEIPIDCLVQIKPKLKEKSLTINEYVAGLYLATIQEEKTDLINNVTLFTPISLRMVTEPKISFDDVMCSAITVDTLHDISQLFSPEKHAVGYKEQLRNIFKHLFDGEIVNLSVTNIAEYIQEVSSPRNEFVMGFGLSNIGRFDFGVDPEKIEVNSFGFGGSRRGADYPILLCVLSDSKCMRFIFNYTVPIVQQEWIKQFAQKLCLKFVNGIL